MREVIKLIYIFCGASNKVVRRSFTKSDITNSIMSLLQGTNYRDL